MWNNATAKEAMTLAMRAYSPSAEGPIGEAILRTTHTLLLASLALCEEAKGELDGMVWTCFLIEFTPMARALSPSVPK